MARSYKIINLEEKGRFSNHTFAIDVLEGLSKKPKFIPSKYLYDAKGSNLFEKIMELDEYYLTNSELEILKKCKKDLRHLASDGPFRILELGVGDAKKTKILLHHLLDQGLEFEYVPVDFCQEMIEQVVASLKREFKHLPLSVLGIVGEYYSALSWLSKENPKRSILLFLGSSIGNFERQELHHFLHYMWNALKDGDYVFIGFDLKKDIGMLEKAYNDSAGVTREFNLNLLDRINRELEANFDRDQFVHHGFYNPSEGRMESWLISKKAQTVTIGQLQKAFDFQAWEGIRVENSHKYNIKEIEELAEAMGFENDEELIDSQGYFAEAIWLVKKMSNALGEAR